MWTTRVKRGEVLTVNGARISFDATVQVVRHSDEAHIICPDGHEVGGPNRDSASLMDEITTAQIGKWMDRSTGKRSPWE